MQEIVLYTIFQRPLASLIVVATVEIVIVLMIKKSKNDNDNNITK